MSIENSEVEQWLIRSGVSPQVVTKDWGYGASEPLEDDTEGQEEDSSELPEPYETEAPQGVPEENPYNSWAINDEDEDDSDGDDGDNFMAKSVDQIYAEWIEFEKGGPGSGEHPGHPFRGNKFTGGIFNAKAHNDRPGYMTAGMHTHLSAAHDRVAKGNAAMAAGHFSVARKHFNEAAWHYGMAAKNSTGPNSGTYHQMGAAGYALAHHSGDMAKLASISTGKFRRAARSGADGTTLQLLGQAATTAQNEAHSAASALNTHANSISAYRQNRALQSTINRTVGV